ncbi:hypothetical protein B0H17DRAFT_1135768 [Mycena rosella]|uniref:Restriction of telomere capping protein 4 C-terminal domain-containing protein n=1 Tax=Mycena rosella TaxID=1033263 RepID=A0AAD7DCH8_MYCRO|nr:hypothetical protein B0H17DRAFT_1135768 [Mycena rosella]
MNELETVNVESSHDLRLLTKLELAHPDFLLLHFNNFPIAKATMPPKRKLSPTEELEVLRAQVTLQQKQLAKKDQEIAEERAKNTQKSKSKLIPCPKSQAGRGNGYNLQTEMRLDDNSQRFLRLSRLIRSYANQYLPTGKTIKKQDKAWLDKYYHSFLSRQLTIAQMQTDLPFFQRFQGAWPIRALLKQYLRNCAERLAEAEDSEDWSDNQPSRSKSKKRAKVIKESDIDSDEDEDEDGRGGALGGVLDNESVEEEENDEDGGENGEGSRKAPEIDAEVLEDGFEDIGLSPDFQLDQADWDSEVRGEHDDEEEDCHSSDIIPNSTTNSGASTQQQLEHTKNNQPGKRKVTEIDPDHMSGSPVSKKLKLNSNTNEAKPKLSRPDRKATQIKSFTPHRTPPPSNKSSADDLPSACPGPYCTQAVPAEPGPELIQLFKKKQELIAKEGKNAPGCFELTRQICRSIAVSNRRSNLLNIAEEKSWPLKLDFGEISDRVFALRDHIIDLASDSDELAVCPVWLTFLGNIKYKMYAFAKAPVDSFSAAAERSKRCGYFGPEGQGLIASVVDNITGESLHRDQIFQTVASLIDTPDHWDKPGKHAELISASSFIDHILVPYVATCLIADDLEISFEMALVVKSESSDFGRVSRQCREHYRTILLLFSILSEAWRNGYELLSDGLGVWVATDSDIGDREDATGGADNSIPSATSRSRSLPFRLAVILATDMQSTPEPPRNTPSPLGLSIPQARGMCTIDGLLAATGAERAVTLPPSRLRAGTPPRLYIFAWFTVRDKRGDM